MPNPSTAAGCLLVLVLAYVLSIGPVMRLADRGIIEPETFDTIYMPLIPFTNIPGFVDGMNWYLWLWEPHYTSDQAASYPPEKAKPSAITKKTAKP